MLGGLCDPGSSTSTSTTWGYVKAVTEVSSGSRALLACARVLGEGLPDEGDVGVLFDDSIVQDTAVEKRQDMDEVAAGLMEARGV